MAVLKRVLCFGLLLVFLGTNISAQNDIETVEFLKSEVKNLRKENVNYEGRLSLLEADIEIFKKLWKEGQKEIETIKKAAYQQCTKGI